MSLRPAPLLASLVLLLSAAPASASSSDWSIDFSKRSVDVHVSSRGHRVSTRRYAPRRVWVPGRYEFEEQSVWVPGCTRQVWVEPVYELRYDSCGRSFRVLVRGGHYETVRDPGHYETRRVRVWRPGFWRVTHGRDC